MTSNPPLTRGQISADGRQFFDSEDWGWQPLWFSADEVLDLCRTEFGVPARSAQLLGEGMLNQSWRLACADHDRVLRVSRTERSVAQVRYERVIAQAWARVVPAVVQAEHEDVPEVDGHALTLFPFIAGVAGVSVPAAVRARAMAPVLAAMHRAALALGLPQRPGFTAVDEHPRWFGWPALRAAITDRFGHGRDVLGPIASVDRAIQELDELLDGWQTAGRLSVRACVHGDLNPRNQLYRGGALVGILDTDDCGCEPLVWEVSHLAYSSPDVSPASVWRDYLRAGGPLPAEDEELLLAFARMGALSELQWLTGDDGAASHLALRNLTAMANELDGQVSRD